MIGTIEEIIERLNESLSTPKGLGHAEWLRCIEVCTQSYIAIKAILNDNSFNSIEEEIYFFKHMKPKITSKYFYHLKLYQIETALPMGSTEVQIRYYEEEVRKLDNYVTNHQEFCNYMRREATYMDHIYFTRGNKNPELFTNYQFIEIGHEFATSHGFVLARISANKQLYSYLSKKIDQLEHGYPIVDNLMKPIPWEGSKVNMVILMYGLIETGQVNCDINTLANHMQKVFDVELKDIYRVWADVKTRKKELFPWLQEMMKKLEDRAREE
jgi:hypothetical protein